MIYLNTFDESPLSDQDDLDNDKMKAYKWLSWGESCHKVNFTMM